MVGSLIWPKKTTTLKYKWIQVYVKNKGPGLGRLGKLLSFTTANIIIVGPRHNKIDKEKEMQEEKLHEQIVE